MTSSMTPEKDVEHIFNIVPLNTLKAEDDLEEDELKRQKEISSCDTEMASTSVAASTGPVTEDGESQPNASQIECRNGSIKRRRSSEGDPEIKRWIPETSSPKPGPSHDSDPKECSTSQPVETVEIKEEDSYTDYEISQDAPESLARGQSEFLSSLTPADKAREFVNRTKQILHDLQSALGRDRNLPESNCLETWRSDANALERQIPLPSCTVAAIGDTGHGKSSLLNAVLDHANILPTSGMKACTAVVIELGDNECGNLYEADVEFLSKEEWEQEVKLLLETLRTKSGKICTTEPDMNRHPEEAAAWSKLRAVNGEFSSSATLEQLMCGNRVTEKLGTVVHIKEARAETLRSCIGEYVEESADPHEDGEFWPVIKKVSIRIPNCQMCRAGTILVDLPGSRDSNAARDSIAKEYLKKCSTLLIVANINRAVHNKTAKDVLGDHLHRQLLMDGQYGNLAYICTMADIIVPSEIARALKLSDETCSLSCAKARNNFSRTKIRQNFRTDIKKMKRQASFNPAEEDELEDSDDETENDPKADHMAENLNVFCVSSLDYMKLTGLLVKDGPPQVFQEAADTEVPRLQQYLQQLGERHREPYMIQLLQSLYQLMSDITGHLNDSGLQDQNESKQIHDVINAEVASVFSLDLCLVLEKTSKALRELFSKILLPKLGDGTLNGKRQAVGIAEEWGAKPNKEAPWVGGLCWSAYKATCRRKGIHTINFNEELAGPLYSQLTIAWDQVFNVKLPQLLHGFRNDVISVMKKLIKHVENKLDNLVDTSTIARLGKQLRANVTIKITGRHIQVMCEALKRQRDLTRIIPHFLQQELESTYEQVMQNTGVGSFERMKQQMVQGVTEKSSFMYDQAATLLQDELETLQSDIVSQLHTSVEPLRLDAITSYQPLWESHSSTERLKCKLIDDMSLLMSRAEELCRDAQVDPNTDE